MKQSFVKTLTSVRTYLFNKENKKTILIVCIGFFFLFFLSFFQNNYLIEVPKSGGSISEALVGSPRFVNPVLAQSQTDKDLVELVYGSLVSIDPTGQVVNELAESITVSEDQTEYIVTLSQDAYFHDGEKITATDVVFTIEKIQDAIIQSPERAKWSGVTVEEIAEYEILFNLDQAYPLFLQNLELGILPEHIWTEISAEEFPFSTQNIQPIGSGPFKVAHVTRNEKEVITNYELTASRNSLFSPFLDSVNIHILKTPQEQVALYTNNLVDAVAGINPSQIDKLNLEETTIKSHVLPRVFSLSYKQAEDTALSFKEVRQVIDLLIDKEAITQEVFNGYARTINSPLSPTSPYASTYEPTDQSPGERLGSARALLNRNSWTFSEDRGVWTKKVEDKNIDLVFTLHAPNTDDLILTSNRIRNDLSQLQIPVTVLYQDIESLTQDVIRPREFELLLFGYVTDIPADLYPFWHSSGRTDPGLNITEYVNINADKALETIRKATGPEILASSYTDLQKAIVADIPATFLFSPEFIYLQREHIAQAEPFGSLAFPEDRFRNISSWYTKTEKILPLFLR